jgi:O-antigen biosynthesis protein
MSNLAEVAAPISTVTRERPRLAGKHLFVGENKFYVRGVTYGPFRPDESGNEYGTPAAVERDFERMRDGGINAVRTYTVPPRWLLDAAARFGLRVMVGLPWEQHIAFLDDAGRARAIEALVREGVRACAGHPAVLCYAIGNEIPASIVRWHGARPVERFLRRLYLAAKAEDPEGLVTYVNFPTTEYLELPFLDLLCFNVYLEQRDRLEAYLARLQNLAGDRPLLMAEIGLDSRRNGVEKQAEILDWQVRVPFEAGCVGAFVFSWTDEWFRGGHDIDDWDFGLVTRGREPKPALEAVRDAFAQVPVAPRADWPRISVVVCSYNGSRTIGECLQGLERLEYPDYEVIVVDDGSTDATARIVRGHAGVRLIRTENRGLSAARNTGMAAATGEIVAYIDDDACPDPHWLTYLAASFRASDHAGIGGPNIPPPGDGPIAEWVAHAPGGPVHVLLDDTTAEHIPGCNMAFRKSCLEAVGGFDPQFRAAGDDVDLCWRLQQRGWTLGFSPAAMVWHHRRNSVRAYWKQQRGYGQAEAMLERKWPEKYNAAGHIAWAGRLYGKGVARLLGLRGRIYHGTWGSAPFQSVYAPAPSLVGSLPLMPEWYLVVVLLGVVSLLGLAWPPLLLALPVLLVAALAPFVVAVRSAHADSHRSGYRSRRSRYRLWAGSTLLHLLQPIARLNGRLRHGLTPWRQHADAALVLPRARRYTLWSEEWRAPEAWLAALEERLRAAGVLVVHGGDFDDWDMEVRGGVVGAVRLRMGVEEHGGGKQLVRFRCWPRWTAWRLAVIGSVAGVAALCLAAQEWVPGAVIGGLALALVLRKLLDQAVAQASLKAALDAVQASLQGAVVSVPAQAERPARRVPVPGRIAGKGGKAGKRPDALVAAESAAGEVSGEQRASA